MGVDTSRIERLSGSLGNSGVTVGLDDLKHLFQPN